MTTTESHPALEGLPVVDVGRMSERNYRYRAAVKHTPGRVTSRLYSRLRRVANQLSVASSRLARSEVDEATRAAQRARLRELYGQMLAVRAMVPAAASSRAGADEAKAALGALETAVAALRVTVTPPAR